MGLIIYGNDDSPVVPLLVYMFSKIGCVFGESPLAFMYYYYYYFVSWNWSWIPCRDIYFCVTWSIQPPGQGSRDACCLPQLLSDLRASTSEMPVTPTRVYSVKYHRILHEYVT
jgi:hypothetical protein